MHRYNRYNQHRMTLNTVGFEPAVFNPIEFNPVEANYDILNKSMALQEERKQKAIAQQSAINAAISEVELAPEEDEWKQNYIADINNQIQTAANVGDYAGALNTATQLAGKATIDPALRGRERYNKERQKFIEELKAKRNSKLISEDSFERAIAENKYNYKDIPDANGNIVAGSSWTPTFDPRKDVNLTDALNWMKTYLGVSSETTGSGGGSSQTFYDAKGNVVTDPKQAVSIRSTTKNGSRAETTKEVTAEDWANAYKAYIQANPELEADFNQLWDNERWMFAKLTRDSNDSSKSDVDRASYANRANTYWDSLTDDQGGLLSKDAWLLKRIQPSFDVMAYRQHSLVTEGDSTLLDETTLKNRVIGQAVGLNLEQAELYGMGAPMEVILAENAKDRKQLLEQGKKEGTEFSKHVK